MGFANGIYDLKKDVSEQEDLKTMLLRVHIDYVPIEKANKKCYEINEFMEQLFPIKELRTYMWQHLASTLIGTNDNQTLIFIMEMVGMAKVF